MRNQRSCRAQRWWRRVCHWRPEHHDRRAQASSAVVISDQLLLSPVCSSPSEDPCFQHRCCGDRDPVQGCLKLLANTEKTKPLNTSLLCLEDCHDNTRRMSWRAGLFVGWKPAEKWPFIGLKLVSVTLPLKDHYRDIIQLECRDWKQHLVQTF